MTSAKPVLLIFDAEPSLADLLGEQLPGWMVRGAADADTYAVAGGALLAGPVASHPGIALALRRQGMIGPIFSLGDGEAPAPLIALAKPLRLQSLIARLEAQGSSAVDGAVIGNWILDLTQRALIEGDRIERLTDKEFSLLELLLLNKPETVDRDRLQTEIWRYHADADSHTVETHVWRLRQKLEVDPANPKLLLTGADGYYLKL